MNLELLLLAFYEFFKTGLFALGGGLATIPFLTEMMNKYHWFTADMLTDMIAVSESTPGAIGINMQPTPDIISMVCWAVLLRRLDWLRQASS